MSFNHTNYYLGFSRKVIALQLASTFQGVSCIFHVLDNKYYIEITMKNECEEGSSSSDPKKRPLVRCDSESVAQMVSIETDTYLVVLAIEI